MVIIDQIIKELIEHETEFNRIYKCLNKTKQNKKQTIESQVEAIIKEYNYIKSTYISFNNLFSHEYQSYILQLLTKSHDRLTKIFKQYKLHVQIPKVHMPNPEVLIPIIEETEKNFDEEMATFTVIDFINFATKLIPEYDGSPSDKQRFIDAVNLVDKNVGAHMSSAVEVAKSKLKGTARNFITTEDTLKAIVDQLTNCIKSESSNLILSKLKNLKQQDKSANDYIMELEKLTASLKRAYITEGVPVATAESYTTSNVVQAMKSGTNNDKMKLIMEAGEFKTVAEASAKFLSVSSELNSNQSQINYFQQKRYNNFGNNRGFQSNSYRGNNYRNNYNRNFDSFKKNNQNYDRKSANKNYFRRGYESNNRQVRYTEGELGNSNDPQSTQDLQLRDM